MTLIDHLKGLFGLSFCFWVIYYLYSNYSISRFIVKRYKKETHLSETAFFRKHIPFILYFPDYISGGFFAMHLLMCVWGWGYFGGKKVFVDIESPELVTRYFSRKEIRMAKWVLVSGLIFFLHGILLVILQIFIPQYF
jgi:hypothetical protein